jgi:hypothetical protein
MNWKSWFRGSKNEQLNREEGWRVAWLPGILAGNGGETAHVLQAWVQKQSVAVLVGC